MYRNEFKWIKGLNVSSKFMKFLKYIIGVYNFVIEDKILKV